MASKKPASKKPASNSKAAKKGGASKGGGQTLADLFDETDSSEASNLPSPGEHTARINSMELKVDPKKGTAVFAAYEVTEGDEEGKKIRQMYKLLDEGGNKAQGMAYLKKDLELLGYEDASGKKLKSVLKEISDEQPIVVINVKESGQYTNAYLLGLAEEGALSGDGDDDAELEVGDSVLGENEDGDDVTGEIIKIKGDTATVETADGEKHKCELSALTRAEEGESEEEEEEEAEAEIEVGSTVTGEDKDGEEVTGEVTKIRGELVTVQGEDGEVHKCNLDDLSLADGDGEDKEEEEDEESGEIEVGSRVTGENEDGDDIEGEVVKIKGDNVTVEDDEGEKHKCSLDDLTLAEEDEEGEEEGEGEIEVGSSVTWEDEDGEDKAGEVLSINEKKGTAKVEDEDGDKHTVELDDLTLA